MRPKFNQNRFRKIFYDITRLLCVFGHTRDWFYNVFKNPSLASIKTQLICCVFSLVAIGQVVYSPALNTTSLKNKFLELRGPQNVYLLKPKLRFFYHCTFSFKPPMYSVCMKKVDSNEEF